MIETFAMITVLAGMGVYFVKSTDLPRDLKERSERMQEEARRNPSYSIKKFSFKNPSIQTDKRQNIDLLAELKKKETLKAMEERNLRIDELTLAITSLEQELKDNQARNAEILSQIDLHLEELRLLKLS